MFITLEGPEGSGKTTQIPMLAEFLRQQGYDVLATREPGGTDISDQIRAVLHDLKNTRMQPRTEALLYQAARAQLIGEVVRPHLQAGGVVLSDRYADSTLAYQGYGHGLPVDQLATIIHFATDGLKPDLTILLDLDVEVGLRRRSQDGEWNRLDAYAVEFHHRVRKGYHQLAAAEPARWVIVDADQPLEQIQQNLRTIVSNKIKGEKLRLE